MIVDVTRSVKKALRCVILLGMRSVLHYRRKNQITSGALGDLILEL